MNESTPFISKIKNCARPGPKCKTVPPVSLLYMAVTAALISSTAQAEVVVASGNTTVSSAANGVQVVDIASANGAGVSHNVFNRYDVDTAGQVLNNNASSAAVESQLASSIAANANLGGHVASLIINEVAGNQRSALNGQLEVAGSRADVVIANPNGIICSGCGFINVGRATLATGTAELDDISGALKTLHIEGGDVTVEGKGLKVGSDVALDLLSREIRLYAPVSAGTVDIVAGRNDVNYATLEAQSLGSADGPEPKLAIDSSSVGGISANRIHLISTESGIGVKMEGDAAANTGEFTLASNGDITLKNTITAGGDIAIESTTGYDSVSFSGGGVHSAGDITISAGGDISTAGTAFTATGSASLHAGSDLSIGALWFTTSSTGTYTLTDYEGYLGLGYYTHKTSKLLGSSINVGGNLDLSSGWATTITASDLIAAGVATVNSGTDFSLLAGYDKDVRNTYEASQGLFMGGGVYGFRIHTTSDESTIARSASLIGQSGAQINSGTALTVVGSSTNANLNGGWSIDVLSANNVLTREEDFTTTSFLTVGASATPIQDYGFGPTVWSEDLGISIGPSAIVGLEVGAELNLVDVNSVSTSQVTSNTIASKINSAGDLIISSAGEITLSGAQIGAGGNLDISGRNVSVLADTDSTERTTVNTRTRLGLFGEAGAATTAGLSFDLGAMFGTDLKPKEDYKDSLLATMATLKAGVSLNLDTGVSAEVLLGVKHDATTVSRLVANHVDSVLSAGNNIDLNAQNITTLSGAELSAGDGLNMTAAQINSTAVYDEIKDFVREDSHVAGLYLSASASGSAQIGVGTLVDLSLSNLDAFAGIGASTSLYAGIETGVRYEFNRADKTVDWLTAYGNTLSAGGDIDHVASVGIYDEGTQANAGGDITQQAGVITDTYASNSQTTTQTAQSHDARLAFVAETGMDLGVLLGISTDPKKYFLSDEEPLYKNVGIRASYKANFGYEESKATQAIASQYNAGGNFTSTATSGQLDMHGTQINANGVAALKSSFGVSYGAAHDTSLKTYGTSSVYTSAFYDLIDQLPKLITSITKVAAGDPLGVVDLISQIPSVEGGFSTKDTYDYTSSDIGGSLNAGSVSIQGGAFANLVGTHIQSDDNIDISAFWVSVLPGLEVSHSGGLITSGNFSFSTTEAGGSAILNKILSLFDIPTVWLNASISGYVVPTNLWLSGHLTDIAELNAKGKVNLSGFAVLTPLASINSHYSQLNPSAAAVTFLSDESDPEEESKVDDSEVIQTLAGV